MRGSSANPWRVVLFLKKNKEALRLGRGPAGVQRHLRATSVSSVVPPAGRRIAHRVLELFRAMFTRIMYIESKAGGLAGPARIGRVRFSRTRCSLYYRGRTFQSLKGRGFKANYFDVETGEYFWISGPRRDGCDRLYGERLPVLIDEDVREEYWTTIRRRL